VREPRLVPMEGYTGAAVWWVLGDHGSMLAMVKGSSGHSLVGAACPTVSLSGPLCWCYVLGNHLGSAGADPA
jgi:hypothetical protein